MGSLVGVWKFGEVTKAREGVDWDRLHSSLSAVARLSPIKHWVCRRVIGDGLAELEGFAKGGEGWGFELPIDFGDQATVRSPWDKGVARYAEEWGKAWGGHNVIDD